MANEGAHTFFLYVLMPIVFMSAIIGILQHYKILPFMIKYIGFVLSKINGMGKLESYNAVAAAIVGQNEVFISVKNQIGFYQSIGFIPYVLLRCQRYRCPLWALI